MKHLLFALALLLPAQAGALEQRSVTSVCGHYDELAASLAENYGESPRATGIHAEGSYATIIFVSEEGTYTVVNVDTDQVACVVSMGMSWERIAPPVPGEES